MPEPRIAVVGATGAVGGVTLQLLRDRGYGQVRALASTRSAGRELEGGVVVEEATPEALGEAGINIEIISTSSIRVSCVVRATEVERAVQAVHDRFRGYAEERVGA